VSLLTGDIGGTNTRLALVECANGCCEVIREQHFDSRAYDSLTPIVREFLRDGTAAAIETACFGVAGPVRETARGQFVKVTNLPWEIDGARLASDFRLRHVQLINDFQAVGYGIEALAPEDFVVLQSGAAVPQGPRAVIGAGTGLGQGILVWQRDHYEAIATEGGHAEFGPTDDVQIDLARFLVHRHGHASYELILSGSGLVRLYEFLAERKTGSAAVAQAMTREDPAAVITRLALDGTDALCGEALDLFASIYGAQAGNLALTAGATGGVYIAGGIAPRVIARLKQGGFMRAFCNKANMSHYVAALPVRVVLHPQVGLLGAARVAARNAERDKS
jgi:glucokinase